VGLKEFVVRISNRKLAESYLKQVGIGSEEKMEQCLRIIDKVRKESRATLSRELAAIGVGGSIVDYIFTYISLVGTPNAVLGQLLTLKITEEEARKGVRDLEALADALAAFGRLDTCLYDMSIVRGIGYYDGIVFECFDKESEDLGSIFGGGRYDKLCRVYGKRDIPATGVAGGIERLMISLERANLFPKSQLGAKVFIASAQDSSRQEAVRLTQRLREEGIPAELDLKERPLSKQMEYANSAHIPYLIVLGPQEIESGMVRLRDMASRAENPIPIGEVAARLRSLN
jgi:histidyl-tRNA synthetase